MGLQVYRDRVKEAAAWLQQAQASKRTPSPTSSVETVETEPPEKKRKTNKRPAQPPPPQKRAKTAAKQKKPAPPKQEKPAPRPVAPALVAASQSTPPKWDPKEGRSPASPGDVTNGLDEVANWESFIGPGTIIPQPALDEMQKAHAACVKGVRALILVTQSFSFVIALFLCLRCRRWRTHAQRHCPSCWCATSRRTSIKPTDFSGLIDRVDRLVEWGKPKKK